MNMTQNKKSSYLVIFVVMWLFFVYAALKCGMAWDDVIARNGNNGEVSLLSGWNEFQECVQAQFQTPFAFAWSDTVRQAITIVSIIWFLICLYIYENIKNYYAHGKIHGTSKWGGRKAIRDLFAVNIMKKELFRIKLLRFAIGRFFARRRARKYSIKQSDALLAFEVQRLNEWKEGELAKETLTRSERKTITKEYKAKRKKLETFAQERANEFFASEWDPYRYKRQYEAELDDIERKHQQGLLISNDSEERAAKKEAKSRYKKANKDFRSGKYKREVIRKKYNNADAIYTKTERISIYNWVLNNNSLVIGASSSGKTRSFVLPNVLQAHSSFVITDPKGEILQKTGFFLQHIAGYKVRVLNLYKLSESDGYNPFVYVHPEREGYETRILALIEALIANTEGGEQQSRLDPFWQMAERLFLQAIFFFTVDGFPIEERNMNTVMSLIRMLKIKESDDKKDSDLDYFVDIFAQIHGETHVGVKNYREFRNNAIGRTATSIVISAVARLRTYDVPEVDRIFGYDTLELDRIGEEKTALFVVVPPTEKTFNFVAGMMFTQLFQEIQHCATEVHKHDGMRVPVPIRLLLDEFATTCAIPNFTELLAYARSLGVGISPIIQSLAQLKKIYEKDWGTIIDNCGALLFLGGVTHDETLDYISEKLLGKGTWDKRTFGKSRGSHRSDSQNYDEIGRVLKDSSELRRMPKKDCILVVNGRDPFYSEKYDYTEHPNYIFTSDASRSHAYDYTPQKPPKKSDELAEEEMLERQKQKENAKRQASKIVSDTSVSGDIFKFNSDGQYLLKRLGEAFPYLVPIRNELLDIAGEDETELIMSSLGFDSEDKIIDDMLSEARREAMQIKAGIEKVVFDEQYRLTSNSKTVAKFAVSAGRNLAPIRNELFDSDKDNFSPESFEEDDSFNENVEDLGVLLDELQGILNNDTP